MPVSLRRGSAALLCCSCLIPAQQPRTVSEAEAARVHNSVLLIDTHNDWAYMLSGTDRGSSTRKHMHTDTARLRAGNVGAVFFAAYVAARYAKTPGAASARAREMIGVIEKQIIARHADTFRFARSAAEIESARRAGRIAALIGIEGGHAIEDSLERLGEFYRAGVRYMTLTHTNTNNWADSSGDKNNTAIRHHGGLNDLGRRVIGEMNRLGMIVDVSHVADDTFQDVLEVSRAPVFASHSSCRALAGHARNMTDDMIRAMAKRGGVIQINFACDYISARSLAASREKPKPKVIPPATLAEVVAQIDHAVRVGGIDAVGIGSDFDGIDCAPTGLEDVSKFPNLTRALLDRGYSEEQIRKIHGGNTLRLLRAVEAVSQKSRAGSGPEKEVAGHSTRP